MSIDLEQYKRRAQEKFDRQLLEDPDRERRLELNICKDCFYSVTLAGQAFWPYTCEACKKELMHHNTAVPRLCLECAKSSNRCRDCTGDMD